MEKIFELTVLFAYRRALALGADDMKALKAAQSVLVDAKPDLEETEARIMVASILAAAIDLAATRPAPPVKGGRKGAGATIDDAAVRARAMS
jgi:hypothetical protein